MLANANLIRAPLPEKGRNTIWKLGKSFKEVIMLSINPHVVVGAATASTTKDERITETQDVRRRFMFHLHPPPSRFLQPVVKEKHQNFSSDVVRIRWNITATAFYLRSTSSTVKNI
ncbi:hypothetical protein RB195_019078 [Necator americanus]|uniref:Uncharacterized protein n=1 Tax=Necator americanus TaxID=51031 RepID=A0ABR1CCI2_NECAM